MFGASSELASVMEFGFYRHKKHRCGEYLKQIGADNKTLVTCVQRQRLANGVRRHSPRVVTVGRRRWWTERVVGLRPGSDGRLDGQPCVQLVEPVRGADVQPAGPRVDQQVLETAAGVVVVVEVGPGLGFDGRQDQ